MVAETGGPDILLHANVLRNFGQSSVADGAGIEIIVQETTRGMQATEVLSIDPPAEGEADEGEHGPAPDLSEAGPMEPARVKWFDKGKGFGFANVFGRPEDVFIHVEVLRRSGLADLQPGEAICLRVIDGQTRPHGRAGDRLGHGHSRERRGVRAMLGPILALVAALMGQGAFAQASCAPDRLDIRGDWGQATVHDRTGRHAGEQARGLMFRESLGASEGMLFLYPRAGQPGLLDEEHAHSARHDVHHARGRGSACA